MEQTVFQADFRTLFGHEIEASVGLCVALIHCTCNGSSLADHGKFKDLAVCRRRKSIARVTLCVCVRERRECVRNE